MNDGTSATGIVRTNPYSSGIEARDPAPLTVLPTEMTPEVFKARIAREGEMRKVLKEYVQSNMVEGHHFSRSLGNVSLPKPMLLQEGMRNICSLFKLFFGEPRITEERLDGEHYRVRTHIALFNAEGRQITSGDAVCSTRESKYAYRKGDRVCPECGRDSSIIKGRSQYGGGWICYEKKGGCGAKFEDDDTRITDQQLGRIDNPDKADVENTVLKISIKRAKVAAVCDVGMVSEIFAPEDGDDAAPSRPTTQNPRSQNSKQAPSAPPNSTAVADNTRSELPQSSIKTAVDLSTKLQKEHGVDYESLAMQFLPEGVAKFSELTEAQAAEVVPGLVELLNGKVKGR